MGQGYPGRQYQAGMRLMPQTPIFHNLPFCEIGEFASATAALLGGEIGTTQTFQADFRLPLSRVNGL